MSVYSQQQKEYPDTIIESYNSLTKTAENFFGGTYMNMNKLVPLKILLSQNDTFVSLPRGSYIVVGFLDKYIIDAPGQPDIMLEEVGGSGEYADVFVSHDNIEYTHLGVAGNGIINKFDLATISYDKPVHFIKIVGLDAKGVSPGFDLRNLYGLPGSSRRVLNKPVILDNILFEVNKAILLPESFVSLDHLLNELKSDSLMFIEIRGHTDNRGTEVHNQQLSENRAKSVLDYLVEMGIHKNRLSYKGFGSSSPVATNATEDGRKLNRRVEFVRVK